MITEPSFILNFKLNHLTENLIQAKQDDFEVNMVLELQNFVEQIKQKRNISTGAARKVATEFIGELK